VPSTHGTSVQLHFRSDSSTVPHDVRVCDTRSYSDETKRGRICCSGR
jgi:hypothetical protein